MLPYLLLIELTGYWFAWCVCNDILLLFCVRLVRQNDINDYIFKLIFITQFAANTQHIIIACTPKRRERTMKEGKTSKWSRGRRRRS